ncbi:RDD family protein [Chloroflexota bacterium]
MLFLSIFFFPATSLYSGKCIMGPEEHLRIISDPICLVFLFTIFACLILMEAYIGWTVGKLIVGLRVVDGSGGKIGVNKSIIRNLIRLIDGLPAFSILGIVLIATSQSEQRFGDRIAKTYLIRQTPD